jgi:hypothetical protein
MRSTFIFIGLFVSIILQSIGTSAQVRCEELYSSKLYRQTYINDKIDTFPAEEITVYSQDDYAKEFQRLQSVLADEVSKGNWLKTNFRTYEDTARAIKGKVISGVYGSLDGKMGLFVGRVVSVKPSYGDDYSNGYDLVIEGPFGKRQKISRNESSILSLYISKPVMDNPYITGDERIDTFPAEEITVYSQDDYAKEFQRLQSVLADEVSKGNWLKTNFRTYEDTARAIKGKVISGVYGSLDGKMGLFVGRVVSVKPSYGDDYSNGYDLVIEGPFGKRQKISRNESSILSLYISKP